MSESKSKRAAAPPSGYLVAAPAARAPVWLLAVVFLVVSVPVVLLLQWLQVGGEFRVIIAMAAGAMATAFVQSRAASSGNRQSR